MKKKIAKKNQTHGEVVEDTVNSLYERYTGVSKNKFGTTNDAEFKNKLESMSADELRSFASKNGIIPVNTRSMIIASLMRKFYSHIQKYSFVEAQEAEAKNIKAQTSAKKDSELQELLKRGK